MGLRERRVLICDDDKGQYERLRKYLEEEGFACAERVESEEGCRAALDEATRKRRWFEFVMIDMDLRGASTLRSGVDIYFSIASEFQGENCIIYSAQDVERYRDEINRLMYRDDVALVLLDELMEKKKIHLHLRRLLQRGDPSAVFVVHGRHKVKNKKLKKLLTCGFGLDIVTMEDARDQARAPRSYVYEVVLKGIEMSQVTVVLFTDEERVELAKSFVETGDIERKGGGGVRRQARANVYIEAGYAMGKRPAQTIFVEWPGSKEGFYTPSDFSGLHTVRFKGRPKDREQLARRLERAGAAVVYGKSWRSMTL